MYDVTPNVLHYESFSAWEDVEGFDFFKLRAPGYTTKVLVAPHRQKEFEEYLATNQITNKVDIEDYGVSLDEERASIEKGRVEKAAFSEGRANFEVFWRYNEMEAYVDSMVSRFPQLISKEVLTVSPEGRNIYAIRISNGVFGQKPIIAMESGMHAREW